MSAQNAPKRKGKGLVLMSANNSAGSVAPGQLPRGVTVPKNGPSNGQSHRYPTMPADQMSYYSRSHYPLALEHFTIPQYMREQLCRIDDKDEANSGLELYVRLHRHLDIQAAFGRGHFHMPFALTPPDLISFGEGTVKRTSIDFIVETMLERAGAEKLAGELSNGKNAHESKKRALNGFFEETLLMGCMAMRDPRELAAAALVGFQLFNPFSDTASAIRAGAFMANGILLSEGMPPLAASDIGSPVLALAVQWDTSAWYNCVGNTALTPSYATNYIKEIKATCHVCDKPGRKCTRCHGAYFCGEACLRKDYVADPNSDYVPRHVQFCKKNAVAAREAAAETAAKQGQ